MKKNQKFEVGQKVKLVDNRKKMGSDIACGFGSSMPRYFGEIVTIAQVRTDYGRNLDYVRVEENDWSWDLRFLQSIDEKPASKVHDINSFKKEEYILPMNFYLKKIIENDRAVICFITDKSTGATLKTVAVCQEGDEFEVHKGVEVCMYKTLRKIADKNLRKF